MGIITLDNQLVGTFAFEGDTIQGTALGIPFSGTCDNHRILSLNVLDSRLSDCVSMLDDCTFISCDDDEPVFETATAKLQEI